MTPSTDWKERIEPGEAERFERYAEQLRELQRASAKEGKPARALHAKGNLGLEAELTVLPDLPEHLRVGPFAEAKTYKAYVRYSNGAGRRQGDRTPDVRGVALKLLGVPGKKLIPGMESAPTQDFLLIRSPSTPFRSADEFVPFALAIRSPATALPKLLLQFGLGRTFKILGEATRGLSAPLASLAATRYFSAVPTQFGKYAVRYALTPSSSGQALPKSGDEYLGEELANRLKAGPVSYDLQVQFFVDEARTPIEDASVNWEESVAPYTTVARLTLPQQDPASPRGQKLGAFIEGLSFDPWHALVELKPLGNIMRARNAAYRLSTQERKAAPEPDGSERFE